MSNPLLKISCRAAGHYQGCRQAGEEASPDHGDSRDRSIGFGATAAARRAPRPPAEGRSGRSAGRAPRHRSGGVHDANRHLPKGGVGDLVGAVSTCVSVTTRSAARPRPPVTAQRQPLHAPGPDGANHSVSRSWKTNSPSGAGQCTWAAWSHPCDVRQVHPWPDAGGRRLPRNSISRITPALANSGRLSMVKTALPAATDRCRVGTHPAPPGATHSPSRPDSKITPTISRALMTESAPRHRPPEPARVWIR